MSSPFVPIDNNRLSQWWWDACGFEQVCDPPWLLRGECVSHMFTEVSCVASRISLSMNDGSCEGASSKCDSNYGCLVSCSMPSQLLRLRSTPVSMTDCGWGKHIHRATQGVQLWIQLWLIMANNSSMQLATRTVAASAWVWRVWLTVRDKHNLGCSVWAAAAQTLSLRWEWLVIKAANDAGAASSTVETNVGWAEDVRNRTAVGVSQSHLSTIYATLF